MPLPSYHTVRLKPPRRLAKRTKLGSSQNKSMAKPNAGRNTMPNGPSPVTW